MDIDDARAGMAGIEAAQARAVGEAGAPLPSTLAGLLTAAVYAAGLPLAQRMIARRLRAAI